MSGAPLAAALADMAGLAARHPGAFRTWTPRRIAAVAVVLGAAGLFALGVSRMIMISGDHQKAAQAIADQVGLSEAWGDLMPEDKVEAIKRLRAEGKIAMVGDGVNDAPAMATATAIADSLRWSSSTLTAAYVRPSVSRTAAPC